MKAWMSSNFGKFAIELWSLINIRIEFLLNILKKNKPIKTKFSLLCRKCHANQMIHRFFFQIIPPVPELLTIMQDDGSDVETETSQSTKITGVGKVTKYL